MPELLPCQLFKSWDLILRLKLPPSLTSSAKKVEIGKHSCMCTALTVLISPIAEGHSRARMKHRNSSERETPHTIPISATPNQESLLQHSRPSGSSEQWQKQHVHLWMQSKCNISPEVMQIPKHFLWLLKFGGKPNPCVLEHKGPWG